MLFKQINFEVKDHDDAGAFSGYGAVFDNVDSYGDKIIKGAFLEHIASAKRMPSLLWQHRGSEISGIIKSLKEDNYGLFMEGQLALKTQRGAEAHELMKMGAIDGLSIGYEVPAGGQVFNKESKINELHQIKLWEISIVTFPANELARVSQVKQILENGGMPTERELEGFLKEIGFSRTQSKALISKGYKAIQREVEDAKNPVTQTELKEIIGLLTFN